MTAGAVPETARNGAGAASLRDLLDATNEELRRRGVITLSVPSRPAARRGGPSLPRVPTPADLPATAMEATGRLALALRRLAGRDVIDLETLNDLVGLVYRIQALRESHRDGLYDVDDFGFDQDWTETLLPIARLLYRRWWRVDAVGLENVPRRGGALLVSNHSGVLPLDGAMIKVACLDAGPERHVRALIAGWFFGLPVLSWVLRRSGQTLGHPDDTARLLDSGELVLVFPEGVKGTGKPFRERYRLRRFGRGGFVEAALRAQVPIIPVSVVGAEEIYPMLADVRPLAELTGFPYFPLTPTWPWLGPLGLVPLPSKWRIRFHEPVRTDLLGARAAGDARQVMALADEVRDVIQAGLIDGLMHRRTVFRG